MNVIVIMTLVGAGVVGAFIISALGVLITEATKEVWNNPTTDNVLAVVFFGAMTVTVAGLVILMANGAI
jgi:DMSO reductase anchor subunit